MAIKSDSWPLFAHILKQIMGRLPSTIGVKALSLGTTDFVLSKTDVAQVLGAAAADKVHARSDSSSIAAWHGAKSDVLEAKSLYAAMGIDIDFLDVAEIRGGEIIQDLNLPLAPGLANRYDIVIDSGTLEHCFNVGQAISNVAQALKIGGIAYHGNPMLMMNHGFFNFCPTFYFDFYNANGFKVLDLFMLEGNNAIRPPTTDRFALPTPAERTITAIAQKMHERAIVWPTQTKYVASPAQTRS